MTTRLLFPICLAFLGLRAAHAQTALPYLLSAEEANAAAEEALFPGLYTMRVATPRLAYTGQAVVRLSKQSLSSTYCQ